MASSRFLRLLKFFLPLSIILLTSAYLFSSSTYDTLPTPSWAKGAVTPEEAAEVAEKKATFIKQAAEWEIDGPFNNTALSNLCESKKWQEGLHFRCAPAYGGIGNVRNIVLTCVRYAIEAGATTIQIPEIIARSTDLINLETGDMMPFSYMFDLEDFTTSLTTACPRIRLVSREEDFAEYPSLKQDTRNLTAKDLGIYFKVVRVIDFAEVWRPKFDKWVKEFGVLGGFTKSKPMLVALQPAFFEFPILYDPVEFTATYGRILTFRKDLRRLAGVVLYALDKKYHLELDPAATGIPAPKKFYGAHLRTDVDAIAASFAKYEEQSTGYLAGAQQHKLPFIYLASGSKPDTKRFIKDAKKMKIAVTTKMLLLEGDKEYKGALAEMKKLTWDQQALIDMQVLLRSSHFGGTWASSFAFNIAFRRHVVVCDGGWVHSKAALAVIRDKTKEEKQKEEDDKRKEEERKKGEEKKVNEETKKGKAKWWWWKRNESLEFVTRSDEGAETRSDPEGTDSSQKPEASEDPTDLKPGEAYKDDISTIYGRKGLGIWFEMSMWP